MPELPEVETVCRQLREREPVLIGRLVREAQVHWPRTLATPSRERFCAEVAGMRVHEVTRHGKNIIVGLRQGQRKAWLLVHLRMSGKLDVVPAGAAMTKHARLVLMLDKGLALRFDDARKFGRVWFVDDPQLVIGDLGPDAMTVDESTFTRALRVRDRALKPLLLDQSFVAGVGNIYADESLHRAKLHPERSAASISAKQAAQLHACVVEVLREGIAANGASFDWVYPSGNFQENFRVYGRTGKPCTTCGAPIQRLIVGQRSTHICPRCQKP